MPKVSVIIPAYNAEATLAAALNSVLAQTFADFEVLVVNDGSTDSTASIVKNYIDPRIRLVSQANRGLPGARNSGIRHASGEFLAFLDADDLWLPNKLERHVGHLEACPRVGVSYAPSRFIDSEGRSLEYRQKPKLRRIRPADVLCRNPVGNGSAPVVRRAALDDIAFQAFADGEPRICYFDETLRQSEDVECWVRIITTTDWQFQGLREPLTLYRVHTGALSADVQSQFKTWNAALDKMAVYAPDLIRRYGHLARAYQLRYLARRAVRSRQHDQALRFMVCALLANVGILWREPLRTISTFGAATLLFILPKKIYDRVEQLAMMMA